MRTIREEVQMMLTARQIAAHHAWFGHPIEAAYYDGAAKSAENRARCMIREMHDITDPPEAAEWLTDEELDEEIRALEAAGETGGARWCELDAEMAARFFAAAA